MIDRPVELTMEQQFALRSFSDQVNGMSEEQTKDFLVKLYEQMMIRETMYLSLIKREWNIQPPNL